MFCDYKYAWKWLHVKANWLLFLVIIYQKWAVLDERICSLNSHKAVAVLTHCASGDGYDILQRYMYSPLTLSINGWAAQNTIVEATCSWNNQVRIWIMIQYCILNYSTSIVVGFQQTHFLCGTLYTRQKMDDYISYILTDRQTQHGKQALLTTELVSSCAIK